MFFDIPELIRTVGLIGIFIIVFAESGLLIGFFLPGDSLLFTAGFLASQGLLDIKILLILVFAGAVLGDNFGYAFGRKVGHRIFNKEDSLLFHKDHLKRASNFYEKHGGKAIILARFMPFIRTFAPIVAGIGKMDYKKFFFYNLIGGAIWGVGLTLAGFYLGRVIPDVDRYLLPIIALIVIISVLPGAVHILKSKEHRGQIKNILVKIFK